MKKRLLYLSIAFLCTAILALIIVAMRSLYPDYCLSTLGIILFFIYLIIAEINLNFMYQHSLRKRQHKRTTCFNLSLITLALVLLSLLARLFL